MCDLSIVIPVYHSRTTVRELVKAVHAVFSAESTSFEIILVNDGSADGTDVECTRLCDELAGSVRYIEFARNFSENNAILAGVRHAKGAYGLFMDDDFQNPPSEALKLYRKIRASGADVVYSRYDHRAHPPLRKLASSIAGKLATWLYGKPEGLYLSSFKAVSRSMLEQISAVKTPFLNLDAIFLASTRHFETETVEHRPRLRGKSGYSWARLFNHACNLVFAFSIQPARALPIALALATILLLLSSILFSFVYAFTVLLGFWMILELTSRTLAIASGRPQYVIRKTIGFTTAQYEAESGGR